MCVTVITVFIYIKACNSFIIYQCFPKCAPVHISWHGNIFTVNKILMNSENVSQIVIYSIIKILSRTSILLNDNVSLCYVNSTVPRNLKIKST